MKLVLKGLQLGNKKSKFRKSWLKLLMYREKEAFSINIVLPTC
jgi:hypothetical protein